VSEGRWGGGELAQLTKNKGAAALQAPKQQVCEQVLVGGGGVSNCHLVT
jgi:hypothetical protein